MSCPHLFSSPLSFRPNLTIVYEGVGKPEHTENWPFGFPCIQFSYPVPYRKTQEKPHEKPYSQLYCTVVQVLAFSCIGTSVFQVALTCKTRAFFRVSFPCPGNRENWNTWFSLYKVRGWENCLVKPALSFTFTMQFSLYKVWPKQVSYSYTGPCIPLPRLLAELNFGQD